VNKRVISANGGPLGMLKLTWSAPKNRASTTDAAPRPRCPPSWRSWKSLSRSRWGRPLIPHQRRQRTLDALKDLWLGESEVQPLLLIVENLHWIDTETQVFLERLIDSQPAPRLLLLVSYRPEYQHGWGSKTYYTSCSSIRCRA
jgi:hypothetical protein